MSFHLMLNNLSIVFCVFSTIILLLGHDKLSIHGKAEGWDRTDVERVMHKMLADNFLYEEFMITREDMSAAYLRIGPDCQRVFTLDKVCFPLIYCFP
jgi:hypothetical protein